MTPGTQLGPYEISSSVGAVYDRPCALIERTYSRTRQ